MIARLSSLAAAVALVACGAAQGAAEREVAVVAQGRVVAMETTINGETVGPWPYVEEKGVLYVTRDALAEWRLKARPNATSIVVRGEEFVPLSGFRGFSYEVNYSAQSVAITFAPEVFPLTKVGRTADGKPLRHSPLLPSVFLNYDLNLDSVSGGGSRTASLGAMVEGGTSFEAGLLTSTIAGRNLLGTDGTRPSWARLETAFTRPMLDTNTTLRIGDSALRPSTWGSSALFGGLQFGTDYSLTPGFLTRPIPVIGGVAASASTVELYVNNVLKQVGQVPPGPFVLGNTATLTGKGEARLIVRDVLGREMVTTQPFFTNASLLAKGLADWGVEAGALRQDYGIRNFHYGPVMASGTFRYGLSDTATIEAHGEATPSVQDAGIGVIASLPFDSIGRAAVAVGRHAEAGTGEHWLLGLDRQFGAVYTALQAEGSTRNFRLLAQGADAHTQRLQVAANLGYASLSWGTFGLGAALLQSWDGVKVSTATANYSVQVGRNMQVSGFVSKAFGQSSSGYALGVALNVQFDNGVSMSGSVTSQGHRSEEYLSAITPATPDGTLGWRVLGGRTGGRQHAEAGVYYQGKFGNVSSEISTTGTDSTLRLQLSGGLVVAEGSTFITRRIDQAYAVVEAEGVSNVGVGIGGNVTTYTNDRGLAVVTNLVPNVANNIRLDANAVPSDVQIDSIEQIAVPGLRSAVKIKFPVRVGRSALVTVHLANGEVAPAGAMVRVEGQEEAFIVARYGQVYLTGLQSRNVAEVSWDEQMCRMRVDMPPGGDNGASRIGPITCEARK